MTINSPIPVPQKIAFYHGDVTSATIQSGSLNVSVDADQVYFCVSQNTFIVKSGGVYYGSWSNSDGWKQSSNIPYIGTLYVDISEKKVYSFNEVYTPGPDGMTTRIERRQESGSMANSVLNLIETDGFFNVTSDIILMGSVKLGSNTTIAFLGGKISGNSTTGASSSCLIGNNTAILAPISQIFSGTKLMLQGEWNVAECFPEWWGAMGDGRTDDTFSIQTAVDFASKSVKLLNKQYAVNSPINITQPIVLQGERQFNDHDGIPRLVGRGAGMPYIIGISSSYVTLKNFTVKNEGTSTSVVGVNTTDEYHRLVLEGVGTIGCNTGFYLHTFLTTLDRCTSTGGNLGFYIHGGTSITMQNCFVKSFIEHAYYLFDMTYSTLINCCADTHNTSMPDGTTGDSHKRSVYGHTYSIKDCKGLNLMNCAAEKVSKGFAVDNSFNVLISNCRMDMQKVSNCVLNGSWLYCVNVRSLVIDGAFLSNNLTLSDDDPTTINFSRWYSGWYSQRNLIYSYADSSVPNAGIRLKNVFLSGQMSITDTAYVNQNLRSSLMTGGENTDIVVEYEHWKRYGSSSKRPIGRGSGDADTSDYNFDDIVGVGFTYLLIEGRSRSMQVWTGSNWVTV